jgi:hypothetical protein
VEGFAGLINSSAAALDPVTMVQDMMYPASLHRAEDEKQKGMHTAYPVDPGITGAARDAVIVVVP